MNRLHVALGTLPTRLARRERFGAARAVLSRALARSGEHAGAPRSLPYGDWPRDADGAPTVVRGWHASVTDTAGLAAALVAPFPAALDAEWSLRPRWEAARERFRESLELGRLGGEERAEVLALWTAKEALLKLARIGLGGLARTRLARREGELFFLALAGREHVVRVRALEQHLLACAAAEPVALELHALPEIP
jgi:hypothetical protein